MPTKTYPNLTTFQPDSGGLVGVTGLVPPPQPGDAAAGNVLSATGAWVAGGGGSTVISTGLASNISHAHTTADLPDLFVSADLVLLGRVFGG